MARRGVSEESLDFEGQYCFIGQVRRVVALPTDGQELPAEPIKTAK